MSTGRLGSERNEIGGQGRDAVERHLPADATGRETACVDTPAAFPWEAAMQVGFGVLRLSSEAFWTLTPRELASVFGAARRGTAPTPGDLARLMRRFPDRAPQKTDPPGQNG